MKKFFYTIGSFVRFWFYRMQGPGYTPAVLDITDIVLDDTELIEHEGTIEYLTISWEPAQTLVKFEDGHSSLVSGHPFKRPGESGKILKTDNGFLLE